MEAVPKLAMLEYDLKSSPDNSDLIDKLKAVIHLNYREDPETFAKELEEFSRLRSYACIRPIMDFSGLTQLRRYYAQLHLLQNRFKIKKSGPEEAEANQVPFVFSWYELYSGTIYQLEDIEFEMASVLYNIGALHSHLGAAESRTTSDSMKVACTHFQCAAWAFHTLPDRYTETSSPDLSPELLALMASVSLAQAQECILEKSILDHRKSSIIAKVGIQVALYYYAALHKLETSNLRYLSGDVLLGMAHVPPGEESIVDIVGLKINMRWKRHLEFKHVYYKAVAYLYAGINAEESQKMGERVTWYQAAAEKLKEATKHTSSSSPFKETLIFANDVIQGKLENAKKENEFIYHEKVPEFDTLPELKGASLVKGVGFEVTDPDVAGADIFGRLVPLEAHEASSMYSEEKAKLLRSSGDEIEEANTELAVFMSSMGLDGPSVVPSPEDHVRLPQELIEVAAKLSVSSDSKTSGKLAQAMENISTISLAVENSIKEIRHYLDEDKGQEDEYIAIVGEGKRRPTNIVDEISKECDKYGDAHRMASESNSTLHSAMRLHIDNLKLLSLPLDQLQKEIPSLSDLDEESEANIAEVRRILGKVDEMKSQRNMLAEKFRSEVMDDDITKKLVVHKGKEMDEIFDLELKKHEATRKVIRQNLAAQKNILQAMTEVNAKYAKTRQVVTEMVNARNEMIGSLVASFYAHEDLLHKAAKGLEFYDKLDSNVDKLLHRVKGVCKVQQEERDAVLAKSAKPFVPDNGFMPGAPPLEPMEGGVAPLMNVPPTLPSASPTPPSSGGVGVGGKPTLKDYMKMMKETNSDASAVYAAMHGEKPAQMMDTSQKPVPTTMPSATQPSVNMPSHPHSSVPHQAASSSYQFARDGSTNSPSPVPPAVPSPRPAPGQSPIAHPTPLPQWGYTGPTSQMAPSSLPMGPAVSIMQRPPVTPSTASVSMPSASQPGIPPSNLAYQSNMQRPPIPSTASVSMPSASQPGMPPSNLAYQSNMQRPPIPSTASVSMPSASQPGMPPSNLAYQSSMQRPPIPPPNLAHQSNMQRPPVIPSTASVSMPSANQPGISMSNLAYQSNMQRPPVMPSTASVSMLSANQPGIPMSNLAYQGANVTVAGQQNPSLSQATQPSAMTSSGPDGKQDATIPSDVTLSSALPAGIQQGLTMTTQANVSQSSQHSMAMQPNPSAQRTNPMPPGSHPSLQQIPQGVAQPRFVQPSIAQPIVTQMGPIVSNQGFSQNQATYSNSYGISQVHGHQQQQIGGFSGNPATLPGTGSFVTRPMTHPGTAAGVQPNYHPSNTSTVSTTANMAPTSALAGQQSAGNVPSNFPAQVANPTASWHQGVYSSTSRAPVVPAAPLVAYPGLATTTASSIPQYQAKQQQQYPHYHTPGASATHYAGQPHPQQTSQFHPPGASAAPVARPPPQPQGMSHYAPYQATPRPTLTSTTSAGNPVQYPGFSYPNQQQTQVPSVAPPPQMTSGNPSQQSMAFTPNLPPQPEAEVKLRPIVPMPMGAAQQLPYRGGVSNQQQQACTTPLPAGSMAPAANPSAASTVNSPPELDRRSSLDDMLDVLEEKDDASVVLVPKVLTASEQQEQKKQAQAIAEIAKATNKDPFENSDMQQKLLTDYNELSRQMCDEKYSLDNWKRLSSLQQQADSCKQTISVARCYPMKNRVADVLPFDNSRVELPTTKDDYINASHIRHLSTHSPCFIATQWPAANTFNDFWTMVWQEKVETIAALTNPPNPQDVYWPVKKEEPSKIKLSKGSELEVTLQSVKTAEGSSGCLWTERIFTLMNKATNTSRVVIHLHILESKGNIAMSQQLSELSRACLSYYRQQRILTHPVLVHCLEGSGRTASFLLMAAAMSEIDVAAADTDTSLVPDMVKMAALMNQQRKGILREKMYLKMATDGVVYHAKHILVSKEVLKPEMKTATAISKPDLFGGVLGGQATSTADLGTGEVASNLTAQVAPVTSAAPTDPVTDLIASLQLNNDPMAGFAQKSPSKKKITKADFANSAGDLTTKNENSEDPLSQLDPLWSLKSK